MPRVIWQGMVRTGPTYDGLGLKVAEVRIIDSVDTKSATLMAHFPAPVCGLTAERLGKDSMGGPLWLPVGTYHDGGGELLTVLATALREMFAERAKEPTQ
jgi:hypothetical protein